jgi:hypothetical protein
MTYQTQYKYYTHKNEIGWICVLLGLNLSFFLCVVSSLYDSNPVACSYVCVCGLSLIISVRLRLEKAWLIRIQNNDRLIRLKATIQKKKDEVRAQLRRDLRQRKLEEETDDTDEDIQEARKEDIDEDFNTYTSRPQKGHVFVFGVFCPFSACVKPSNLTMSHHKKRVRTGDVEEGRPKMVKFLSLAFPLTKRLPGNQV